ncbi:MAG: cyclase family protein [Leptospiraceae bacterium]|nr:cyclase family protein [Leptospiraceae bacterium]MCB1314827.1 cyclase family protein [Leptospiraceae bacterium]MCB1321834.1 cyclase family protein [Leptospiraceae bacterium]
MQLLSYSISEATPMYGGGPGPGISVHKCQQNGDSCNQLHLEISNHTGTHLDCPYHFDSNGKRLTDYPDSFWYCEPAMACVLSKKPEPGTLLSKEHVAEAIEAALESNTELNPEEVQALLIKTGYCNLRSSEVYTNQSPGIHADMYTYLRDKFPELKFFGFDLISISSYMNRDHGRISHKAFLANENPILPIEDMDLRKLNAPALVNILVSPIFIDRADGAPCSVWANIP